MRELFERPGSHPPSRRRRWPYFVLGGFAFAVVAIFVVQTMLPMDDPLCALDDSCEPPADGPEITEDSATTSAQTEGGTTSTEAGAPPIDRAAVDRQLALLSCGHVEADYGEDGLVLLSGVATPGEAAQLETQIRQLPGVRSVASQIQAQAPPFCGALGVLLRHAQGDLDLLIDRPGGIYHAGDHLTVTVRTPSQVSGHRQVDAFDHEGNVVHLSPNERAPETFQAAGTEQVLGESGWRIEVAEPFGPGLIMGFLTREALFPAPRPLVEPAEGYLRDLEQQLQRLAGTDPMLGGARPIETRP